VDTQQSANRHPEHFVMTKKSYHAAIADFLAEEDGPTAVEYAVLLTLILLSVMGTVGVLAENARENFDDSAEAINGAFNN
jgi:pilus assembly protein Flp/PilA